MPMRQHAGSLALYLLVATGAAHSAVGVDIPATAVHIHRDCKQGVSFTVNESKEPTTNLADDLAEVLKKHGDRSRLNVIGHKGTTVEDLIDIRGLAGKIGLEDVRLYWVADIEGRMIEVKFEGTPFPVTSTPP